VLNKSSALVDEYPYLIPSYLEKLSVGKHTLKVEFTDELSAAADFKVLQKSEPEKPASYIIPLTGIE